MAEAYGVDIQAYYNGLEKQGVKVTTDYINSKYYLQNRLLGLACVLRFALKYVVDLSEVSQVAQQRRQS